MAITGEPRAASQAYRHDYNLLLPQIVSPVALLGLPLAISRLTSHLFTTTTYLEKSSQSQTSSRIDSPLRRYEEYCEMWRMFSVGVRAPYKANVSDNPWPDVVPGVFVGVIKTKKYFPIFHSRTKAGQVAWEAQ